MARPIAVTALLCLAVASPANAAALYFEKVEARTNSEASCLQLASGVISNGQGFKSVHRNASEVAGEKGGAYVSITCVGRGGQPAIAVVMSVASDFGVAKQVGHSSADRIKGTGFID